MNCLQILKLKKFDISREKIKFEMMIETFLEQVIKESRGITILSQITKNYQTVTRIAF